MGILWVCETDVFIVQEDLFAICFHYLLHGDTRDYRGLQEVTRGYRGLEKTVCFN